MAERSNGPERDITSGDHADDESGGKLLSWKCQLRSYPRFESNNMSYELKAFGFTHGNRFRLTDQGSDICGRLIGTSSGFSPAACGNPSESNSVGSNPWHARRRLHQRSHRQRKAVVSEEPREPVHLMERMGAEARSGAWCERVPPLGVSGLARTAGQDVERRMAGHTGQLVDGFAAVRALGYRACRALGEGYGRCGKMPVSPAGFGLPQAGPQSEFADFGRRRATSFR